MHLDQENIHHTRIWLVANKIFVHQYCSDKSCWNLSGQVSDHQLKKIGSKSFGYDLFCFSLTKISQATNEIHDFLYPALYT